MSAERLGRPGSRLARENLCVLPRIAYNATAGVQPTRRKASRAVSGGLLTWAAKPKVRESPKPRKFFRQKTPACFTSALSSSHYYGGASSKVPWSTFALLITFDYTPMDESSAFRVARKHGELVIKSMEQQPCVLSRIERGGVFFEQTYTVIPINSCACNVSATGPATSCHHLEKRPSSSPIRSRKYFSIPCAAAFLFHLSR